MKLDWQIQIHIAAFRSLQKNVTTGGPDATIFFSTHHSAYFSINTLLFTCSLTATLTKRIGRRFPLLTPPPPPPLCTASVLTYKWVSGRRWEPSPVFSGGGERRYRGEQTLRSTAPTAAMATDVGGLSSVSPWQQEQLPGQDGNRGGETGLRGFARFPSFLFVLQRMWLFRILTRHQDILRFLLSLYFIYKNLYLKDFLQSVCFFTTLISRGSVCVCFLSEDDIIEADSNALVWESHPAGRTAVTNQRDPPSSLRHHWREALPTLSPRSQLASCKIATIF